MPRLKSFPNIVGEMSGKLSKDDGLLNSCRLEIWGVCHFFSEAHDFDRSDGKALLLTEIPCD